MSSASRGRGGRNPRDMPRDQQVSRKVSWLLRHGAEKEGLKLAKGGWVNVQEALDTPSLRKLNITFQELKDIVATNDKQRFSLIPATSLPSGSSTPVPSTIPEETDQQSDSPSDYLIRANQGHSLAVDATDLLTPITVEAGNVPSVCVHGTNDAAWKLILQSGGLRKMGRNHVHFAAGLPSSFTKPPASDSPEAAQPPVISGMRNSSTVLIYVDVRKALDAGIKFWKSENGVILTEGNEKGVLEAKFFEKVKAGEGDEERV
ncbi:phosphotransferase KptA/Tpt1 [Sporormia fimetaria CBS 119925]|uniref:2'-phosphotransferase n=1 Tax=Sporormia fimetaria CBS 119925 TaxID=1340428 RepID=A0A6A6V2Z2_9PLEO|nr:phosphotransferase KptA/Tpt1 [Sporormia fimetaria CBS 119925]